MRAPAGTRVIELDTTGRLEAGLSTDLPADPTAAAALVSQRLQQHGAALNQSLAEAYRDVVAAWRLGVRRLPAVIVADRYVVYGDSDVSHALNRIAEYRKEHP